MTWAKFIISIFLVGPTVIGAAISPESTFSVDSHCVAYHAKKRLFLVRTVDVVGKNCEIASRIIPEPGNQFHIEVTVPVLSFESGEVERDRDVSVLLKADKNKNIEFISATHSEKEWKEILDESEFIIVGQLKIAGKSFPVEAKSKILSSKERNPSSDKSQPSPDSDPNEGPIIVGVIEAKFEQFELDPPVLFGGIGAKVRDDLRLIFHLRADKTLGAQRFLDLANKK